MFWFAVPNQQIQGQLPFALLVPFLCLSLCLVSPTDGLPWMVHLLYLSCQGLAVPYQLIPKESSKDEALKAIAEWKVPVYGCQRTLAAEIYQFNVQLLWCGNQYLDVVSVVLAIHMGYPFAAPMAMLFFISLAMQVVPSSNWDQLLLGRSPIALPAESNKVVLNRCLLENLPQLVIQASKVSVKQLRFGHKSSSSLQTSKILIALYTYTILYLGSVLLFVTVSRQLSLILNKAFGNHHHPLLLVIG